MAFEISGINRVLKKLDKISNINTQKAVEDVATDMENKIKEKAKSFSDTSYLYISKCEPRIYGKSYFVDVGLKNDNAPWDYWKNLYFHNYGYRQFFYGHDTGKMTTCHILWFEEAVNSASSEIQKKLKEKVKEEIKKALG